jgi:hypothetical protein
MPNRLAASQCISIHRARASTRTGPG